jgi:hypothetical protein
MLKRFFSFPPPSEKVSSNKIVRSRKAYTSQQANHAPDALCSYPENRNKRKKYLLMSRFYLLPPF